MSIETKLSRGDLMKNIVRYNPNDAQERPDPEGEFVKYEDHLERVNRLEDSCNNLWDAIIRIRGEGIRK